MLDINLIRSNPQKVADALAKKGCMVDFSEVLAWDAARRAKMTEVEQMKARRNSVSASIPRIKKEGGDVAPIFEEMRALGEQIAQGDKEIAEWQQAIFDFVAALPNMPDDDLLPGEKENNAVVKVFGEKPAFDFPAKNHVDLCTALGLIDYERGVKLAGNGYWLYRGVWARSWNGRCSISSSASILPTATR